MAVIHISELERKSNESRYDHHKRLINGKLVDKTLSDIDYSELAEYVYGQPYSSDVARRMMYGSRRTIELIEDEQVMNISDAKLLSELETKAAELRIERRKCFDQRNALNKLLDERARYEEIVEIISESINENLPSLEFCPVVIPESDNDLIVSLNDIHYGATVHNAWCDYDSSICRQMMVLYLNKILSIAQTHRSQNCYVVCAGDCISGSIHQSIAVSNKEDVIEQVTGVSELIAEFLCELSRHFNEVFYVGVAGNHSRINPNKNDAILSERLDNMIEWYLSARLQNFENVNICTSKLDTTMALFDIRGKTYCLVHGDFDGSDAKVQALQTMAQRPLYGVMSGHLHHNSVSGVQGIKTMMAGSFLGMDTYCVQKRIFGKPEQMVYVCDNSGVRCYYDVDLKIT
jgi:hypothetical protein